MLRKDALMLGRRKGAASHPIGFGHNVVDFDKRLKEILASDDEGHLMTFAPTGAGKGTGPVNGTLLSYQGQIVVFDTKGENAVITARARAEMGHEVHVIDPTSVTGLKTSAINPLKALEKAGENLEAEALSLAQSLSKGVIGEDQRSIFWKTRATQVIADVIAYVMSLPKNRRNFYTVSQIIAALGLRSSQQVITDTDMAAEISMLQHSDNSAAKRIMREAATGACETFGSVIQTAFAAVNFAHGEGFARALGEGGVDLDSFALGKPMTIYIVVPPHMLQTHRGLLRLWFATLFKAAFRRRGRMPLPTLFLLDETGQLGDLEELRIALTLMRGYGIRLWTFWQNPFQLSLNFHDWQNLMANCRYISTFGAMPLAAAAETARVLGLPSADALMALDRDDMLLFEAGKEPVTLRRLNYLTDPEFEGLYDPNPYFAAEISLQTAPRARKKRKPKLSAAKIRDGMKARAEQRQEASSARLRSIGTRPAKHLSFYKEIHALFAN